MSPHGEQSPHLPFPKCVLFPCSQRGVSSLNRTPRELQIYPKKSVLLVLGFQTMTQGRQGACFHVTATRTPAIRLCPISSSPPWLCQTLWLIKADCWQLSFKWRRMSLSHSGLILWKRQKRLWSFALMKVTSHVEDQRGICSHPASTPMAVHLLCACHLLAFSHPSSHLIVLEISEGRGGSKIKRKERSGLLFKNMAFCFSVIFLFFIFNFTHNL